MVSPNTLYVPKKITPDGFVCLGFYAPDYCEGTNLSSDQFAYHEISSNNVMRIRTSRVVNDIKFLAKAVGIITPSGCFLN